MHNHQKRTKSQSLILKLAKVSILIMVLGFTVSCKEEFSGPITEQITINDITVPEGFNIEKLYSPGEHEQGSWVSVAKDDKGRLYASDQFGTIYRVSLPGSENKVDSIVVKEVNIKIGMAQGLLWHENTLYALVNASSENDLNIQSGFYKITDTDNDDEFDTVTALRLFNGWGEHGPHNITLAPDGQSLFMVLGNHTDIPEDIGSVIPKNWGEDNLLPVIKDPSGHANDVKAPGGWVVKTDFEGKEWTLLNVGLRNTYDIAFNSDGELFGFDSDMEYDMGMPWYRPIRLCHLTSGGDFGWRTGTGKFDALFPDNLPGVANLGQGSPTGLLEGEGLKFPEYYQNGFYLFDWSYGTMYFASLTPKGSSYMAEVTEFISGVPLPLTNGIVGNDGAMYFLTGGRRLESALYKLSYTGALNNEVKMPTPNELGENERNLRKEIEKYQSIKNPNQIDFLVENLDHEDRYIRFSSRVALENQDVTVWKHKVSRDASVLRKIALAIAIAHQGEDTDRAMALQALIKLDWTDLTSNEKIDFLRAIELLLIRSSQNTDESLQRAIATKLLPHHLKESEHLNKEITKLLSYLDTSEILEATIYKMENDTITSNLKSIYLSGDITKRSDQYGKDVENMLKNMPNQQNISYAKSLSEVKSGWTKALRERYFRWYNRALKKSGGKQYANFIKAIQRKALDNVPDEERAYFESLSSESMNQQVDLMKDVRMPDGPGKNYTVAAVEKAFTENKKDANFANGENFYRASLCVACHSIKGVGGNSGPELTQIGTRFSIKDIAEAIVNPSKTVSDRYRNTIYHLTNGNTIRGRAVEERDDEIMVSINAFSPDMTSTIKKSDIAKVEESSQSAMPAGLINSLNEKELSDLMVFLIAGGDENNKIYN
ncbi:c-type cytochrome [Flagellimonas algicola]|uniref:C-type cytochrome n=1 Tax=Flagellimonas algicola TaxID=2583815 RepID=A0ABY2WPQ1_9FLAO|nr:c-type cytochrome [Allomuricauda algicola]TMU56722.1 c-type cytochrome [Allomuricauda algicola]